MYDILIIGAGITGAMTAYKLSRFNASLALIDKENDIANEATMANSAIIHTGYDPEDHTLKALLNVEGAKQYPSLCKDLGCKFEEVGAYIVATSKEEEKKLDVLYERGIKRDIPCHFLSGDELREKEAHVSDHVTKALAFPTTGVVYPWEVAIACCEVAVKNGVDLFLDTTVEGIEKKDDFYIVHTNKQDFEAKHIINCSGTHADKIAKMVSSQVNYEIRPRKGEYFVLDQDNELTKSIIFPVPSDKGKGVLVVPTVYGNVLLGPNSQNVEDIEDHTTSSDGLAYVKNNIAKTMKDVPFHKIIRSFAGLRPSSTSKDFIIQEYEDAKGFIDVSSIESPGLASAPAIADYVIEHFLMPKMTLQERENPITVRKRPLVLAELPIEERNRYIRQNPSYGKIVCRCEKISEGEIVDALHGVCPARSIKGVKKRVRPGMGRCQGGFCEPLVAEIIARELHISVLDVVLDQTSSKVLESENR